MKKYFVITSLLLLALSKPAYAYREEVILHVDKSYYLSGDVVWLKAYLRNSENKPDNFSVVVYVELIDANNNMLRRLKLKCLQGLAHGNIILPGDLATGNYTIKSYTLHMKTSNWESASIQFPVINLADYKEKIETVSVKPDPLEEKGRPGLATKLKISTNQLTYSQRDKINLNIAFDREKVHVVKGNVSVSVTRNYGQSSAISDSQFEDDVEGRKGSAIKEMMMFPRHSQTIEEIAFRTVNSPAGSASIQKELAASLDKIKARSDLRQTLQKDFGKNQSFAFDMQGNLPHDRTYYPNRYAALPSFEDFIIEVMVEVKIRKGDQGKALRIMNADNSRKVYVYKKDPLILVDGFIQTDVSEIFKMDPAKVTRVDITWSDQTLRLSSIFKLADHGIISIHTTDNMGSKMTGVSFNIHEGFSAVHNFVSPRYDRDEEEDTVPDFRDPLFWAPGILVEGKAKVSFYASDEFGEYLITVVGVTEFGEIVKAEHIINVTK